MLMLTLMRDKDSARQDILNDTSAIQEARMFGCVYEMMDLISTSR